MGRTHVFEFRPLKAMGRFYSSASNVEELLVSSKSGLRKALDDAGVEHFVLHDLRKTVATAVDKHEGLAAASSILGRSNTVITQASYVERAELKADVRATLDAFAPGAEVIRRPCVTS